MSTLCAKFKQRARVLAAGAALTAATLAILPGVAEAQALAVKPVGAAQGGKAVVNTSQDFGASVPRVSTGLADRAPSAATVDSSTVAAERGATAERPLLDGAVNSTTEAVAPAVPAQATATVNENVAVGNAVDKNICLNAALNQEEGSSGFSDSTKLTGITFDTEVGSIDLAATKAAADSITMVNDHAGTS